MVCQHVVVHPERKQSELIKHTEHFEIEECNKDSRYNWIVQMISILIYVGLEWILIKIVKKYDL